MFIPLYERLWDGTVDTSRPYVYAAVDEVDPPETHEGVMVVRASVDRIADFVCVRARPVARHPVGRSDWQGGGRADIEGIRHLLHGVPSEVTEVIVFDYTIAAAGPLPHDTASVAFVVGRRYLLREYGDDGSSRNAAYEVVSRSPKFVTVRREGYLVDLWNKRVKVWTDDDGAEVLRFRGEGELRSTAVEPIEATNTASTSPAAAPQEITT